MKKLMTGNEAIARGVYEYGVKYASAYPGTPSTEIIENIALYKDDVISEISTNEKVALESAIGASIGGIRALASMKHVGLNVAADPLFTCAYTGVDGGLVVITADEPGMHSSQNEQDNRNYAKAAKIPMLEPASSQEAKDMLKVAFEVSEQFDTPVLYRLTTRLCHSKGLVECNERVEVANKPYKKDVVKRVPVPAFSRIMRLKVEERTEKLKKYSDETELNYMEINDTKIGIVASGMCINFAKEVFGKNASYMNLGFTYPLPENKLKEFASKVEKIYVIEENDPYIEEFLKVNGIKCYGKDVLPPYGEMTPDVIRQSILGEKLKSKEGNDKLVVSRPPTFCAGCPHRGFYYELGKRKDVIVAGDIGCYALGFSEPYNAMDYSVCMGGAFGLSHGCQTALDLNEGNDKKVVGVIGDSTLFHTGINGLINAVYNKSKSIDVILDNRITGMTGHQENPGSGFTLSGDPTTIIDIETLVKACGVKNVKVVNPNNLQEVKEALDWAVSLDEYAVIITRYPCVLKKFSQADLDEFKNPFSCKYEVNDDICVGCKKCTKAGCPAISFNKESKKANIDKSQCVGCGVCLQVCPKEAIVKEEK